MSLSASDIRAIVAALEESGWDQATVVVGDVKISVARNGLALEGTAPTPAVAPAPAAPAPAALAPAAPAPAASPAPQPATEIIPAAVPDGHVVSAPSVGVFWRSPQPGAAAFVEVGSRVSKGDTLGIVEVMKLMNNIAADVDGIVTHVHVPNAGAVEYGTPLFTIEVDAE
jgi:acetyl-CoA carboxylase biotin carboxyl carrier protein